MRADGWRSARNKRLGKRELNILLSEGNGPADNETVHEPNHIVLESARFNILRVQDNVVNQRVTQHLLEAEGLASDIAYNDRRAIEALVNSDNQKPYRLY